MEDLVTLLLSISLHLLPVMMQMPLDYAKTKDIQFLDLEIGYKN